MNIVLFLQFAYINPFIIETNKVTNNSDFTLLSKINYHSIGRFNNFIN